MFEINQDGEVSPNFEMILSSLKLSLEPEESKILTVTIAGVQEENIIWTSDTPSVATVENNGKVIAVANGTAKITATYGKKSVVCNVTVATKLVNISNLVGKYVNINIGYVDQMNSIDYTTATNIKKAWRVLSYDSNNGTVNLISTGHPLKFYHQANPANSITEMDKISTQTITVNPSTTCGYRSNGFSTNDVKSLFNNTNAFTGIQPARYSTEGVSITSATPEEIRNTGQFCWLCEILPSDNRCLRSVNANGFVGGAGYSEGGVRLVVSLAPNVTISGGSGTESSPYILNVSTEVRESLVGKYVDINIGYVDQMNSIDYTTSTNIKKAWRVLSSDETNGTVSLISTGHPLKFYHQANPANSITEMDKISTQTITVNPSTTCGYRSNGFSTNDVKSLFNNTNAFTGIQPARYSTEGVSITSATPEEIRNTGQFCWLCEILPSDNRCLRSVNANGFVGGAGYSEGGVRLVVSLAPNVTISGGSGTESSPYTLNRITYP